MSGPPLLFIAGMPASGKSFFGRWLKDHQGYVHIDPEENTMLDDLAARDSWNRCWSAQHCAPFADSLRQLGRVVFNWGFPTELVGVAAALKNAGFSAWWFDAPQDIARRVYKKDL